MLNKNSAFIFLTIWLVIVLLISFCVGPSGVDLELISLRSSRVLLGVLVGASLGLTGCTLQALLRNPLADPYILGVSGGAAAFGTAAVVFLPFSSVFVPPLAAWIGSLAVSIALIYFLKHERHYQRDRALLLGIAINAFASSFITVIKTIAPMRDVQTLLFWLIGNIGYPAPTWLMFAYAFSAPCFYMILRRAPTLELLRISDEEAQRLGVEVTKEKRILYLSASCLIGISVSMCGMIAFVGLITPHILRPFIGSQLQRLLPMSMLMGIILVTGVDTLSRYSYAFLNSELPVGALLALLGAPVFVWILTRRGPVANY